MGRPAVNFIGQKIGRLTITERVGSSEVGLALWKCTCDCGVERVASSETFRGVLPSCGCAVSERKTKHGGSKRGSVEKEYHVFLKMIGRCTNPRNKDFEYYGGRGISVCDRWRHSYSNFVSDMGRPEPGLQLDRIDTDGDYCPGNCRWVTSKVNNRNRRDTVVVEFKGAIRPLRDWAEELGVPYGRLRDRIFKLGWSVEEALSNPEYAVGRRGRRTRLS